MKKIVFMMALMALPFLLYAQNGSLDRLFDKYSGREGYTTVSISQSMFELFSSISSDKDDKDFKEITSKLSGIKILSCDAQKGGGTGPAFYSEVLKCLPAPEYQSLMDINDGGEPVKFMIRKHGGKTTELVMAVGGKDACVIVLQGDIDLKQISKLSRSMNIKGFEHLHDVHSTK